MSGADIFKALLGRGYFPKELPPAFTTEDFGREGEAVLNEWESARLFKKVPKKLSGKKKSKANHMDMI